MNFTLAKSIEILTRTPNTLQVLLQDISSDWTVNNEGGETWSVYNVIGHLIHGEKTDWMPRVEIILAKSPDKTFTPFDRFAQFYESEGQSLSQLLAEFEILRKQNIEQLQAKNITVENLTETGIHPAFGAVTLSQLLATWVVHDLDHIAQIVRVIAKQYQAEVGPWVEYLKILRQ